MARGCYGGAPKVKKIAKSERLAVVRARFDDARVKVLTTSPMLVEASTVAENLTSGTLTPLSLLDTMSELQLSALEEWLEKNRLSDQNIQGVLPFVLPIYTKMMKERDDLECACKAIVPAFHYSMIASFVSSDTGCFNLKVFKEKVKEKKIELQVMRKHGVMTD